MFLGLAGLIDPPRPEVREAVEKCLRAGMEVAALAIVLAVGMDAADDQVTTGRGLAEAGTPDAPPFRPPRRPTEGVFNRLMIEQTIVSGAFTAVVAFANFYVLVTVLGFSDFEARDRLLLLMVLFENYHVFNCRSEYVSAFRVPMRRNWLLIAGVAGAQGLHVLAMHVPVAQRVLQVAPIPLGEWLVSFAMAATILAAMEASR